MSTTTIQETIKVDGVLTDVTSAVLRDPTAAFGVRRVDTGAVVVAAGTELVRQSQGAYAYPFTDPAAGLTYNYWVEVVYDGATYRFERNLSAPPELSTATSYLTLAAARALAATLPGLAGFKAAADDAATAALLLATLDIDSAGPWQGRKYDASPGAQMLEFPRVPYASPSVGFSAGWGLHAGNLGVGDTVWDWDPTNNVAVVPDRVKRACLYQADAVLLGKLTKALNDQHLGIASKGVGSLSVSYRDPGAAAGAIGQSPLCRQAGQFLGRYTLQHGGIL